MIGSRIKQRRLANGLSLRALAAAVGSVSAQAISNYEVGKDVPGSAVLIRLAEALGVRLDYFFRTISVELGEPAYRKHCRLSKSKMKALESRAQDEVERYLETESLFSPDIMPALEYPREFCSEVQNPEDVESRAESLRKNWAIGMDPIDNVTELLEDHGVKVIYMQEDKRFDGCAYPNGSVPVIVVNSNKPGDRLRFDLAHELGHLLLRFPQGWDDKQIDSAAHRFAGAFLVPKEAAIKELGRRRATIALLELHKLKFKYGVSMQAWARRAKDLDIMSENAFRNLCREFAARGWRTKEPLDQYPEEQSTRQVRLVARAYANHIISESRAAELMGKSLREFTEMIDIEASGQAFAS